MCQKVAFKFSAVNLHNYVEKLFWVFPAIRISKCSDLLAKKLTQPAYIRHPWLSISLPQTSCLGIADNRQPTKKYLIAEQVTIPST